MTDPLLGGERGSDRLRELLNVLAARGTMCSMSNPLSCNEKFPDLPKAWCAECLARECVQEMVPVPPGLHELLRAFACKQLGINRDVSDAVLLEEINARGVATDAQDTTAGIPSTQPPDAGSRVTPDTEGPPRKDEASLPLELHHNKDLRTIIAHPFLALAREFKWDDRQLQAAKALIDITVIRLSVEGHDERQ